MNSCQTRSKGKSVRNWENKNFWRYGWHPRTRKLRWRGRVYPYACGYPFALYDSELGPDQEAYMLKKQAKAMKEEIKVINNRIKMLQMWDKNKE